MITLNDHFHDYVSPSPNHLNKPPLPIQHITRHGKINFVDLACSEMTNFHDHPHLYHYYVSLNHHFQSANSPIFQFTRHGKINFVDLAGSEMTKKTKSEGKTLEEANNINKSLMVTSQS